MKISPVVSSPYTGVRASKRSLFTVFCLLATFFLLSPVFASEKNWTGSGDGIYWDDDSNWFPVMEPTSSDDVTVNLLDAPAIIREPFNAKSLSIGGNVTSSVTVTSGVSGTVAPASASDVGVLNSIAGRMILKGSSGVTTLRGTYKDSETALSDEPALVIYFE